MSGINFFIGALMILIGVLLTLLMSLQQQRADDAMATQALEDRHALLKMKVAELERELRKERCNLR